MGLTILLVYFCQENNFNFTSNVTITCSRRELPVCLTAGGHEHAKGEHCPHGPLAPGEEEAQVRPRKAFSVKRADVVSRSVSLLYRLRTCASWRFEDFSSTLLRLLSGRSPKLCSGHLNCTRPVPSPLGQPHVSVSSSWVAGHRRRGRKRRPCPREGGARLGAMSARCRRPGAALPRCFQMSPGSRGPRGVTIY